MAVPAERKRQARALHTEIVSAIEALAGDPASEIERLADHSFRGEVWEKAVPYLRQARIKALTRSAYRELRPISRRR